MQLPGLEQRGHMVVARIAWKELKPEERAKVIDILKAHPHYDEFLKAERPANIPEDEWVFMRAATWADWVRGGPDSRKYNVPKRHFIDHPFVALGSSVKPPKMDEENAVSGIIAGKKQVMTETDREKRARRDDVALPPDRRPRPAVTRRDPLRRRLPERRQGGQ